MQAQYQQTILCELPNLPLHSPEWARGPLAVLGEILPRRAESRKSPEAKDKPGTFLRTPWYFKTFPLFSSAYCVAITLLKFSPLSGRLQFFAHVIRAPHVT
jgi:hypothetical protein